MRRGSADDVEDGILHEWKLQKEKRPKKEDVRMSKRIYYSVIEIGLHRHKINEEPSNNAEKGKEKLKVTL